MRQRCRIVLSTLSSFGLMAWALSVCAAETRVPMTATPPSGYRLIDAAVHIERQFGHGQPTSTLDVAGQGRVTLKHGDETAGFVATEAERLAWIDGLYQARFFEWPTQWRAPPSAHLKDDGTVVLQRTRMLDGGSTAVCFKLPAFEKCVRYAGRGPRELDDWVQALLTEADRRVRGPAK